MATRSHQLRLWRHFLKAASLKRGLTRIRLRASLHLLEITQVMQKHFRSSVSYTPSIYGPGFFGQAWWLTGSVVNSATEELHTRFLLTKMRSPERTTPEMDTLQDQLMNQVETHGANFNTRCSILKTLLRSPLVSNYGRYVASVANSLCDMWWTGASRDGQVRERFLVF